MCVRVFKGVGSGNFDDSRKHERHTSKKGLFVRPSFLPILFLGVIRSFLQIVCVFIFKYKF